MPGSDSLSAGWLCPELSPVAETPGRWSVAFRPYRGGSLQFPRRTVPAFHVLYTGGFLAAVPDRSGTQVFTASVVFAPLGQARLPLVPGSHRALVTMRQTSRDAADCRFARLPCRRLCQRASPAGSLPRTISVPLSYPAAGALPGPDFHRQALRGFVWTRPNAIGHKLSLLGCCSVPTEGTAKPTRIV